MDKMLKIFTISLIVLIVIVPLGLIATGTAYGEWGPDELKDKLGFVPQGLEKLSGLWNAPMQDYNLPGSPSDTFLQSIGYIISAVIGVCLGGSLLYIIGKRIAKD